MKRVLVMIACTGSQAFADIGPDPLPLAYDPAEALTGHWDARKRLFDGGFRYKPTYQWEVFAAPELDGDNVVTAGLFLLELEFDFSKRVHRKLGRFYTELFGIHGGNLTGRTMDIYTLSNNAADRGVQVYEGYFEQPIGPVTIRAGLLSADQVFTLATPGMQLLNSTFGVIGITSFNLTNPTYPNGALAVMVKTTTGPVKTMLALYDGDQEATYGIPTEVGGEALAFAEVEVYETVKLGTWRHSALGSGYYAVLQRQLDKRVGAFGRVAYAPDSPGIDFYADAGIRISTRKKDSLSAGLAYADAESDIGAQSLVELTYQYYATPWLWVQPNLQLLLDREGTTTVLAMRSSVTF